jgi:hypothetical protein
LAGIHAEIAGARYEYWSSFASLPVDVVLAAGQKAKEEISKNIFWMLFTGPFLFVFFFFLHVEDENGLSLLPFDLFYTSHALV